MNRKRTLNPRILAGRVGNWHRARRRLKTLRTGKGFAFERATRGVRSSLPIYRNRVNPATGRPRRDDREVYQRKDAAFARLRDRGITPSPAVRARQYAPREQADAIFGPGTSARAEEALRREQVNPWAERTGRTR